MPEVVNNIKHQVGPVIVKLMQANKIDESSLAKACKISLASLSRIKNNPDSNPTISTLRPIAEYFKITIDQLLGYSPLDLDLDLETNTKTNTNNNINLSKKTRYPVINIKDINNWLQNKTAKYPINHWLSTDLQVSNHAFIINYNLDSTSSLLQNCLLFIDPKKQLSNKDLVLTYNKNLSEYLLRSLYIDDNNKQYIKPIETGNFEYVAIENNKNINIIGTVIETRLQYKLELKN